MAPDTSTLARPLTPAARPEPATTEPAATAATTALPGVSETTTLAAADSAAPPAPEGPPDLELLGDRIATLSARIQAATYELLCYLRVGLRPGTASLSVMPGTAGISSMEASRIPAMEPAPAPTDDTVDAARPSVTLRI